MTAGTKVGSPIADLRPTADQQTAQLVTIFFHIYCTYLQAKYQSRREGCPLATGRARGTSAISAGTPRARPARDSSLLLLCLLHIPGHNESFAKCYPVPVYRVFFGDLSPPVVDRDSRTPSTEWDSTTPLLPCRVPASE